MSADSVGVKETRHTSLFNFNICDRETSYSFFYSFFSSSAGTCASSAATPAVASHWRFGTEFITAFDDLRLRVNEPDGVGRRQASLGAPPSSSELSKGGPII